MQLLAWKELLCMAAFACGRVHGFGSCSCWGRNTFQNAAACATMQGAQYLEAVSAAAPELEPYPALRQEWARKCMNGRATTAALPDSIKYAAAAFNVPEHVIK